MKSSLFALIVVSSLVFTGCFNKDKSCPSCEVTEQMPCAACPSGEEIMMTTPEEEETIVVGQNTPITEDMIATPEQEK